MCSSIEYHEKETSSVMVNSTNINKANNHLSPSLTEHKKMNTTNDIENSWPDLEQAYNCGGVKPVNGGSTPPLYCFTSLVIVETIDILSCFTVFVPSYDLNIQRSPFTRWILLILSKSCSSSNDRPLWLVLYVVIDAYFTAISVLSLAEIRQST